MNDAASGDAASGLLDGHAQGPCDVGPVDAPEAAPVRTTQERRASCGEHALDLTGQPRARECDVPPLTEGVLHDVTEVTQLATDGGQKPSVPKLFACQPPGRPRNSASPCG